MKKINTPNQKDIAPFNAYVSLPELVGPGVVVRYLRDGSTRGRMQIVIAVDDQTNPKLIEKCWPELQSLVKSVNRFQGNNLDSQHDEQIYGLVKWHQEGMNWKMLAMMLNYLAIAMNYSAYIDNKNKIENPRDNMNYFSFGQLLLGTFFALGKSYEDFEAWMEQGYGFFMNDQWDLGITDTPFTNTQIRNRVRGFEDRVKLGKITPPKEDSFLGNYEYSNIHESTFYYMYHKGCFAKANEILDKNERKDWKRHKHSIQNWINKIIASVDNSKSPDIVMLREAMLSHKDTKKKTPD